MLSYGLTELARASGMLAAFTAGVVMGNSRFVYKQGVANFAAALSMIGNIGIFVLMGVLVFPRQWAGLWVDGVLLFLVLTFIARPAAVWLGTLGMRIGLRQRHFMSWAGLRGAVPIVLATYPMAAGLPIGQEVFNLVFFAVLLSVSVQGSTLGALARWLRLSEPKRPRPRYGLELVTMAHSELDLITVDLPGPPGRTGPRLRDLMLPSSAVITLIARGNEVVSPGGNTRLYGWDQVTVLTRPEDQDLVRDALLRPFEPAAPSVVRGAERTSDPVTPGDQSAIERLSGHAVLLGHGRVGAVLAELLRRSSIPFVVIDHDQPTVDLLRRSGTLAVEGYGTSSRILSQAGIADARLLLVTTADPIAACRVVELAHELNPAIEVVTRIHSAEQRAVLYQFPRTRCVHGEEELAYTMARLAFHTLGLSEIAAEGHVTDARRARDDRSSGHAGLVSITVPAHSPFIGRSLASLHLSEGARVMAIVRGAVSVAPEAAAELLEGDVLVVSADPKSAQAIERWLSGQPDSPTP